MSNKEEIKELPWIAPKNTPWGIEVLDLRPISQAMLSTSKDPKMAENAVSYGRENGESFWNQMPESNRKIDVNFSLPIDGKLYPGVLFSPSVMEHKWAIYFDGNLIYFIRSWHREIYAVATTTQNENQLIISNIQGYFLDEEEDVEFTEATAYYLLMSHALNQLVPAPLPIDLKENTYGAGLWAFTAFGNMGIVGTFDYNVRIESDRPLHSHSLLHLAVAWNDLLAIEQYVAKGFDIHALAGDGLTPLHWALTPESLKKLLELGANPNVCSAEGATPIMNEVQAENMVQLQILLEAGADVNAQDGRGFTALHRAAEMGKKDFVMYLLDKGADKTIEAQGYTALSLAEAMKHEEIIKLLKKQ